MKQVPQHNNQLGDWCPYSGGWVRDDEDTCGQMCPDASALMAGEHTPGDPEPTDPAADRATAVQAFFDVMRKVPTGDITAVLLDALNGDKQDAIRKARDLDFSDRRRVSDMARLLLHAVDRDAPPDEIRGFAVVASVRHGADPNRYTVVCATPMTETYTCWSVSRQENGDWEPVDGTHDMSWAQALKVFAARAGWK